MLRPGVFIAILVGTALHPAAPAGAQVFVTTERAQVFLPLASEPGVGPLTALNFSSRDDGDAALIAPFDLRILGETHRNLSIGTNGYVVFGGGRATRFSNIGVGGSALSPERVLAPWWDDLIVPAAVGYADYGVLGTAPRRVLVVEVREAEDHPYDGTAELSWQLRFHEGPTGRIEFRWRGSPTESYSASVGWIGPSGNSRVALRPCSSTGSCDRLDFATLSGRALVVEQRAGPDLALEFLSASAGALPGGTGVAELRLRNVGTASAAATSLAVALSTDDAYDAADIGVGRLSVGPLGPGQALSRSVPLTVPVSHPLGRYRLVALADADLQIVEPSEADNEDVLAGAFDVGYDLAVDAVEATALAAGPGTRIDLDIEFSETGLPFSGSVEIEVHASPNQVVSAADPVLFRGPVSLTALPARVRVTATVPAGAAARFWPVVQLDPSMRLLDRDRTNHAAVGRTTVATLPDLTLSELRPLGNGVARVVIEQRGVLFAGDVSLELRGSLDTILDTADPSLGTETLRLVGLRNEAFDIAFSSSGLGPGFWHLAAVVDAARSVQEVSEGNNGGVSEERFATAPNIAVTTVEAPAVAAAGQSFTAEVDLTSDGLPFTGTLDLDWALSRDARFDPGDIDLGPWTASVSGSSVRLTPTVNLPSDLPPAEWYLLVRADPTGAIQEASESDNLGVSVRRTDSRHNLQLSRLLTDVSDVEPGQLVRLDYTVTSFAAPFFGPVGLRLWFSRDTILDPSDLAGPTLSATLAGHRTTLAGTARIPSSLPPGRWRLLGEVDPENRVPEPEEGDNVHWGTTLSVRGPDLRAEAFTAPRTVDAGSAVDLRFDLVNSGSGEARAVRAEVEFSSSGSAFGTLPLTAPVDLAPGERVVRTVRWAVPEDLGGSVELIVVADARDDVAELEEGNNQARATLTVRPRRPDFVPVLVRAATVAAAGRMWSVEWGVENRGLSPASADLALRLGEATVGGFVRTLAAGEAARGVENFLVPEGLRPGPARLALVVDPESRVVELDESNNRLEGPTVLVRAAPLRVLTATLAPARLGRPYRLSLEAVGGASDLRIWSTVSGALPPGLELEEGGVVSGVPQVMGRFTFELGVRAGGEAASRSFRLDVLDAASDLAVATSVLPPALLGMSYRARIEAVGGVPPLRFATAGLPAGFIAAEDGEVTGTASIASRGLVEVVVEDGTGLRAARTLVFAVLDPDQRLVIAPAPLPDGRRRSEYCGADEVRLFASGGFPPVVWRATELPPGLQLSEEGVLCGVPSVAGTFSIDVSATDAVGDVDRTPIPIEIRPDDGLALRTPTLAPVVFGVSFAQALDIEGGASPYRFARLEGAWPRGVELSEDGRITGRAEQVGRFSVLLEVRDAQERTLSFALTLDVLETFVSGASCRCLRSPSRPSVVHWAVLLLAWVVGRSLPKRANSRGRRSSRPSS